ncbi:hypothetical protein GCM10011374_11160 [Kocuria dechangensis]|uniref:Uncharacterized protein n=1 Tax=Kocuria dechangensis TaxID=1176249 RepID=A0A917GLW2_9MICC|nr:hypothetical protein [Kocuria dechangensis]GGG50355.1 hypothetical protein GCM10011374_11160 [Kocuria dechangensis]
MNEQRHTPDRITELGPDEVFVFGSNARGAHAAGAARTAVERFGAVPGVGHGLQGRSYAIDTMSGFAALEREAAEFVAFALSRPDLTFWLTRVGTGIAGHDERRVAALFADAPPNVVRPPGW